MRLGSFGELVDPESVSALCSRPSNEMGRSLLSTLLCIDDRKTALEAAVGVMKFLPNKRDTAR